MALSESIKALFWNSFRQDTFQLLALGYADIKHKKSADDEETYITGDLVLAIKSQLNSGKLPSNFERYYVSEEVPVNVEGKRGKSRSRLDIVINTTGENRLEYIFEAKRLKTSHFTIGKYIGAEGLGCFTSNQYEVSNKEAGMLAYIQDKDEEYWLDQLEAKLSEPIDKLPDFKGLPNVFKSEHIRSSGDDIDIYHIFLKFN